MWIRYDEDLLDDPEIWKLEKRNARWTRLWLDLAILARKADADGEILFHLSGNPWDIESLARRRSVTVKMYRKFVAAAMELGLLEMKGDTLVFPEQYAFLWRASEAMSGAERTRNCRERKKATASTESQEADQAHHVTPPVTSDVTAERYTALQAVTASNAPTEQKQKPDVSIQKHEPQKQRSFDLGSLDPKSPISEFGEEAFWAHIAPAYEHFVGKRWTEADRSLAEGCLRQPWANQQPNWLIRYYAFLGGLQHMASARNVGNRWGYALSMVHKYAFPAEEFATANARRRAVGSPQEAWQFRRITADEDCYGPDYDLRGDETDGEGDEEWDEMEIAV